MSELSCDGKKTAKTEARENIYTQNSNDLNFMFKKGGGRRSVIDQRLKVRGQREKMTADTILSSERGVWNLEDREGKKRQ